VSSGAVDRLVENAAALGARRRREGVGAIQLAEEVLALRPAVRSKLGLTLDDVEVLDRLVVSALKAYESHESPSAD
jgi:hypothetical protein